MVACITSNSQRLLRRMREIMGGASLSCLAKIEQITLNIAADLGVDACAIYVLKTANILELLVSQGLGPGHLQRLRIKVGQGVVSDVVENTRPLLLSDIRTHSRFYFDSELGEEQFRAFMGVPITRNDRVLGVIVVQCREKRLFTNEELETLQTVAMVVAELVVAGSIVNPEELAQMDGTIPDMHKLEGSSINDGIAIGYAIPHQTFFPVRKLISDDSERELHRLYEAVTEMHHSLKTLVDQSSIYQNSKSREILEAYQMFAQDRGWLNRIQKAVESGLTAEAAVRKVRSDLQLRISQSGDPWFRDRLWDFEDLTNRLLGHLAGKNSRFGELQKRGIILVGKSIGPAELLEYEKYKLKGLILEEGLQAAHIAIIARALDIPVISRVSSALGSIEFGDLVIMDASEGSIFVHPLEETLQKYEQKANLLSRKRSQILRLRHLPAESRDGVSVHLNMNAGSMAEIRRLHETGAEGVGLYRTEIPFMIQSSYPDILTQERLYAEVILEAENRPVVFRTLDIGGDKPLPYMPHPPETNPSLGWRAIRVGLDLPNILRTQLRALLRASGNRELRIMFPMISSVQEFYDARALCREEQEKLASRGECVPQVVSCGAMIEVPSIVWCLDELLEHADFISVGTNDLAQFFFAADRASLLLGNRYDILSPAFLKLLSEIVRKARHAGKDVSVCGEMASRPLEAAVLIALGYRNLSMSANAIGPVKMALRLMHLNKFQKYVEYLLEKNATHFRAKVYHFARERGFLTEL